MKKTGLGALVAGLLLVSGAQTVFANLVWCDDPPIRVVTPGGTNLMVNNMLALSQSDRTNASLITHDAKAESYGSGTRVTVHFYIPAVIHDAAYVKSSVYRFNVTAMGSTPTGAGMVTLVLDVPIT
jgi:hypothetical protein